MEKISQAFEAIVREILDSKYEVTFFHAQKWETIPDTVDYTVETPTHKLEITLSIKKPL